MATYAYDAWGMPRGTTTVSTEYSTIASLNPFRYRGYIYDSETGFYYLQSRYYDPETCRFLNMDSVDYADPETLNGLNLYAYGLNNPVMFLDPTGHFVISLGLALLIGFAVGAAVGFGATVYTDYKDDGEVFNGSVSAGEYIGNTLIGGAIGTAVAGLIYAAPSIGASISSIFNSASFAMATGGSAVVGLTAEQMAVIAVTGVIGIGLIFTRIGKSGNYRIDHHYPNDHSPTHVHISGDDGMTRVDINGNPIQNDRPMTPGEKKAFWKLIDKIIEALMPWL